MKLAVILKQILDYIKKIEGNINYEKWHISVSCKGINQFKYDADRHMEYVKEIDFLIDEDANGFIEELVESLKIIGIDCVIENDCIDENQTRYIYLYRTLI